MVLFVDTDGVLSVYPGPTMTKNPSFRRLVRRYYHLVKAWLIADAVSGGDENDR